jgi:vancomycin resistance protein YoaR
MADKLKTWWSQSKTWHHVLLGLGMVVFLYLGIVLSVRFASANKILPGVSVRGINIGGLTKPQAVARLDEKTNEYLNSEISYVSNDKTVSLKPAQLGVNFDNQKIVDEAFEIGRDGDIVSDIATQTTLPFTQQELMQLNVDKDTFSNSVVNFNNNLAKPAQNASYQFQNGNIAIIEGKEGERVNNGLAIFSLTRQLSNLNGTLNIPVTEIMPSRTTSALERQKLSVAQITQKPIALSYGGKNWDISQQQLLDWLYIKPNDGPLKSDLLNRYYSIPSQLGDFKLERQNVVNYLNGIAGEINQEAVDATLTVNNGLAVVFKQSQDGRTLNVEKTADAIIAATKNNSTEPVQLAVDVKKAAVSDDNIDKLGIKELISEGVTIFPGSSANRLQNIRVGTSKFNGILIKPDQVFSFGEYLGDVGPEQGYAPGIIILENREEKAYGGGLCQVSSTVYRAALLAGLPILQRTSHAFALNYYTAPFGVPGVDATIFAPQVDLKFKNDTGHHILMQAELAGTTLKFRFYGTKTKSGVIRGPFFVSGNNDATQPSHTVFYRDVLDLNGNVIKTDTTDTYYKSSLDFPMM